MYRISPSMRVSNRGNEPNAIATKGGVARGRYDATMTWPARLLALIISTACVVLAVYNTVTPDRYYIAPLSRTTVGSQVRLIVPPGSPAERAGLQSGDVLDLTSTSLAQRVKIFAAAPAGETVTVPVVRAGRTVSVMMKAPAPSSTMARLIDLILVVIEFCFALLVMTRASNQRLSRMVVLLVVVQQVGTVAADFWETAPTALSAFFVGVVGQLVMVSVTSAVALLAIAALPAGMPKLRGALVLFSPVLGLFTALDPTVFGCALSVLLPHISTASLTAFNVLSIVVALALAVIAVAIAQSSDEEQRMRSLWFVSTISLFWFFGIALASTNALWLGNQAWLFWTSFYMLSAMILGPIYATLRHRIVDLNFVISRSAVFAALSLIIVVCFAGVEWLAGKLADSFLREGFWAGVVAQVVSFSFALVIGLYLQSVHAKVESWVNGFIFRERNRKLRLLQSFVREADLLQTRPELLRVTFEALTESIDTDEIALFINDGGNLVRIHATKESVPERLERSDRLVLQLSERMCSFVSEVPSLTNWYVIPLAVRRELIGAVACGRKRDHTAYLPDESHALVDVAQHVSTSYALLLPTLSPSPSGANVL